MMKRAISLFLCIVLCVGLLPTATFAEGDAEPVDEIEELEIIEEHEPAGEPEAVEEPAENPAEEPEIIEEPSEEPTAEEQPTEEPAEESGPVVAGEESKETPSVTLNVEIQAKTEDGVAELRVIVDCSDPNAEISYQWQQLDASVAYESDEAREVAWKSIEDEVSDRIFFEAVDADNFLQYENTLFRCVVSIGDVISLSDEAALLPDPAWNAEAPETDDYFTDAEICDEELAGGGFGFEIYSSVLKCSVSYSSFSQGLGIKGKVVFNGLDWWPRILKDMKKEEYKYYLVDDNPAGLDVRYIYINSGITGIAAKSFAGFKQVKTVYIPASVTKIGASAFANCDELKDVIYYGTPQKWEKISIASGNECLRNADIEFVVDSANINGYVFSYRISGGEVEITDCEQTSTGDVIVPDKIQGRPVTEISGLGGSWLKSIKLPATVKRITSYAFWGCPELKTCVFKGKSFSVGEDAFADCTNLTDVYFYGSRNAWDALIIDSGNENLLNANIHCGSAPVHSIANDSSSNGTVKVTDENGTAVTQIGECSTVLISVVPDNDYYVGSVDVVGSNGKAVALKTISFKEYSFEMPDMDVTISVNFIRPGIDNMGYRFTVTFNKNVSEATGSMSKQTGTVKSTTVLTANAFKLTGYSFAGWNTQKDGGGKSYSNKNKLSEIVGKNNASIVLYAQWKPATYKISYLPNGGSGAPEEQYKQYGKSITLSTATPTRTGYTFKGWATSAKNASAGKVSYKPGASYSANKNLTLYAVWTARTMSVELFGNENTKGSTTYVKLTYGKSVTFPATSYAKTGFVLKGWSKQRHEASVEYSYDFKHKQKLSAAEVNALMEEYGFNDARLFAVWGPVEYSIKYVYTPSAVASIVKNSNPKVYNAIQGLSLKDVSAEKYNFIGFYSDSRCTKALSGFAPGTTGSKTVYVKLSPYSYTLKFSEGKGEKLKNIADMKCTVGKTYTLPDCPATTFAPPKGYTFNCWKIDIGGSCVQRTAKSKFSDLTTSDGSTLTAVALYTPISYKVSFNANGGKFTNKKTTKTATAIYDDFVELYQVSDLQSRSGYTLVGWNTKADGTGKNYALTDEPKNLSAKAGATVTLYAMWEYKVTLNANGGSFEGGAETMDYTLLWNQSIKPNSLPSVTREGASVSGWAQSKTGDKLTAIKNIKPGSTLYVKWKATYSNITVILHSSEEGGTTKKLTGMTSRDKLPTVASLGWDPMPGWNTKADGTGIELGDGACIAPVVTASNLTVDLYAHCGVRRSDFVKYARDHCLGIPYVSPGRTEAGFDCCGLVWYVCNHFGIDIGEGNQNDQRKYGIAVDFDISDYQKLLSVLKPGDLIFFDYGNDGYSDHVAIYSGDGNIIQAQSPGYNSTEGALNQAWIKNSSGGWNGEYLYICDIRRLSELS